MTITKVTSVEQFNNIILDKIGHKKKYIVCDWYATWCVPCMKLAEPLEKLSDKYNKNIYYIKVEIDYDDDMEELADDEYDIVKLPTISVFDSGSLKTTHEYLLGTDVSKIESKLRSLDVDVELDDDF